MLGIAGLLVALAAPAAKPSASADTSALIQEQALKAYTQGRLSEAEGDLREALGSYIRALGMDSDAVPIARHIAELLQRLGDSSSALDYADKALAVTPGDAQSLWIKGSALIDLGRYQEGLDVLEKCVDADSSRLEYVQALGNPLGTDSRQC